MSMTMSEMLLNPIRLRIVTAMTGGPATAKDLAKALPDIPQTTLYRHINVMIEGGLLQVIEEIPQRGTVGRVLGFKVPPSLSRGELTGLSKAEYQQVFTLILTTLLQEAMNSLNNLGDEEEIDLLGLGYQFNEMRLHLDDAEYQELNNKIFELMVSAAEKKAGGDRKQRIFSYFFIPIISPPGGEN